MPIHREINRSFFKKWTREMAYVLGYFAADGTMIKNSRGGCYIEFHSTDKELILMVRKILRSTHKISIRKSKETNHKIAYRIQIGSREFFDDLLNLGFTPNKSLILDLPAVPLEFKGDFVRGYFDGDGCIYFKMHKAKDRKNKRWVFSSRFTSGSKRFLDSLKSSLALNGGFISTKNRGYELVFSHNDSIALFNLMYHNNSRGLYLNRKRNLFLKAINTLQKLKEMRP